MGGVHAWILFPLFPLVHACECVSACVCVWRLRASWSQAIGGSGSAQSSVLVIEFLNGLEKQETENSRCHVGKKSLKKIKKKKLIPKFTNLFFKPKHILNECGTSVGSEKNTNIFISLFT